MLPALMRLILLWPVLDLRLESVCPGSQMEASTLAIFNWHWRMRVTRSSPVFEQVFGRRWFAEPHPEIAHLSFGRGGKRQNLRPRKEKYSACSWVAAATSAAWSLLKALCAEKFTESMKAGNG
jgi:hypothetical protein